MVKEQVKGCKHKAQITRSCHDTRSCVRVLKAEISQIHKLLVSSLSELNSLNQLQEKTNARLHIKEHCNEFPLSSVCFAVKTGLDLRYSKGIKKSCVTTPGFPQYKTNCTYYFLFQTYLLLFVKVQTTSVM